MSPKTPEPRPVAGGGKRWLIVNADDLGRSPGINRGILRAHEQGIVTSASLMVRWPAAVEAATLAREHSALAVGLHLDFCEWTHRGEGWAPVYRVVPVEDERAVRAEAARQLERFVELLGGPPTHLDSHQHVHRTEPVRSVLLALAAELEVPLRHYSRGIRYRGDFFGQDGEGAPLPENLTVENLCGILRALPPGITELGCHPGEGADFRSAYREERAQEVRVLCDPRVREVLAEEGIGLTSFGSLRRVEADPPRFRVRRDETVQTRANHPLLKETP
jgi:chitin disaccharide deacetylase